MSPSERKVKKKLRRQARGRNRQWRKYQATGHQGHLKEFRKRKLAVRYLRRLLRRILREQRPSKDFAYSEFDCKDQTPVPEFAYPGLDHLCHNVLQPMRDRFGAAIVNSGFRHDDYNADIGGALKSVHIYDYPGRDGSAVAADLVFRTGTPEEWAAYARELGADGIGVYSGFIHLDNRGQMGWPKEEWRGR